MSQTIMKLGATLKFNTEKEQDIIMTVDGLKQKHKLGAFISNIIRAAVEHPEVFEQAGVKVSEGGMSNERKDFFDKANADIIQMGKKIDRIYQMGVEILSLAKANKMLGIEDKGNNLMRAQFVLQKQMNEMCRTLGIETLLYESNMEDNISRTVDEVMEFLVEAYDGIFTELKLDAVRVKESAAVTEAVGNSLTGTAAGTADKQAGMTAAVTEKVSAGKTEGVKQLKVELVTDTEESIKPFGETANFDLLDNF